MRCESRSLIYAFSEYRLNFYSQKQSGQAIPLGIAGLFIMTLAILLLFNVSQTKIEKNELSNVADAAAYSGMVWQARGLNFQSYTNRAMVANQVVVGQIISLGSWNEYVEMTTVELANYVQFIPYIGPEIASLLRAMGRVAEGTHELIETTMPALMYTINQINSMLSNGQETVFNGVLLTTGELIDSVVSANNQLYDTTDLSKLWLADNIRQWTELTSRQDSYKMIFRKADLVMDSRNAWTRNRYNNMTFIKLPGLEFLGKDYEWWLEKRGEARLIAYNEGGEGRRNRRGRGSQNNESLIDSDQTADLQWQWETRDAGSVYAKYKRFKRWKWRTRIRERKTLGWSDRYVSTNGEDLFMDSLEQNLSYCRANQYNGQSHYDNQKALGRVGWYYNYDLNCRWWSRPYRAEQNAIREKRDYNTNYGGILPYRDLNDISDDNRDPTIELAVEVAIKQNDLRTSPNIDGVGSRNNENLEDRDRVSLLGSFRLGEQQAAQNSDALGEYVESNGLTVEEELSGTSGGYMSAVSVAELSFKRPVPRDDGRIEYANLFNPYWIVKLKDSDDHRFLAWALRDLGEDDEDGNGGNLPWE